MGLAAGEIPDQPGIHRTGAQLAPLRLLPHAGNIVQQPADLGAGEVGIDEQARLFCHQLFQTLGLQPVADGCRAAALPDDGVIHRFAGAAVPEDGGLPLVGDADGRHLPGVDVGGVHHLGQRLLFHVPQIHGVMLHPAGLGIDLAEGILGAGHDAAGAVEQDGTGTGGSLIQRNNIAFHNGSSSGASTTDVVKSIIIR